MPSNATGLDSAAKGLVLGTAGHIDHGKSALVRALTGVDPDRLPEEKERGITIDLGFAELELGDGLRLSVVDVPGHEKLVRTMVAGATGIDLLMLVVAADEGVMPQTREHVAICQLLGIDRGLVALTKTDLVDDEMAELAAEDVRDLLAGTPLAEVPVVPVSAQTGSGLDALRERLRELAGGAAPRTPRAGPPRLPIDRVFTMRGFGAVVTGTLTGGALATGDEVEVQPGGRRARVRGLQTHGEARDRVEPGVRCAVNLQGLEVGELARGEVVSAPGALRPTALADVELVWLPSSPAGEDSVAIQVLAGTGKRLAHLAPIGREGIAPGSSGFARLHLDDGELPLLPGDRFIARGFSRLEGAGATLGGGVVLDAAPPHRRRSDPSLQRELEIFTRRDLGADLRERVRRSGLEGVPGESLRIETGCLREDADRELEALHDAGEIERAGADRFVDAEAIARMRDAVVGAVDAFHAAEPMRPGMPRATLRGALPGNVPEEVAERVVDGAIEAGVLEADGKLVRRTGHAPRIDAESTRLLDQLREDATSAGLEPLSPKDWAKRLGVADDRFRDLVAHLEREGSLVRAPGDFWFDARSVERLREGVVSHLRANGEIDTAAYKQLTGTTRRTTVPLMELLDEMHVTRRQGDVRVLRKG